MSRLASPLHSLDAEAWRSEDSDEEHAVSRPNVGVGCAGAFDRSEQQSRHRHLEACIRIFTNFCGDNEAAPFGPAPVAFLTYTSDGRVNVIISHGGRKALSVTDRIAAPAKERAEAFASFFAYAGRYTVAGDKIIHHVEAASVQNWVGTDLTRLFRFEGDHLILLTPPISVGGKMKTTELIWERVKE